MKQMQVKYIQIGNASCSANGEIIIPNREEKPVSEWLKELYLALKIDYPKFYKMDDLCKLGFLSVEFLKKQLVIEQDTDEIALLLVSKYSSLTSDIHHQRLIESGNPSPAVFVYTLPNIMLGEVAIRNSWYGEQLCWIKNQWPNELIVAQLEVYFTQGKATTIVLGKNDCYASQLEAAWCVVTKEQFSGYKEQIIQEIRTIFTPS